MRNSVAKWDLHPTFFHVFRSEFVVPTGAIPPEGLSLTVIDRDRPSAEYIGNVRVGRQQLVGTALSSQPLLILSDPAGGLLRLEVVVSPTRPAPRGCRRIWTREPERCLRRCAPFALARW